MLKIAQLFLSLPITVNRQLPTAYVDMAKLDEGRRTFFGRLPKVNYLKSLPRHGASGRY